MVFHCSNLWINITFIPVLSHEPSFQCGGNQYCVICPADAALSYATCLEWVVWEKRFSWAVLRHLPPLSCWFIYTRLAHPWGGVNLMPQVAESLGYPPTPAGIVCQKQLPARSSESSMRSHKNSTRSCWKLPLCKPWEWLEQDFPISLQVVEGMGHPCMYVCVYLNRWVLAKSILLGLPLKFLLLFLPIRGYMHLSY